LDQFIEVEVVSLNQVTDHFTNAVVKLGDKDVTGAITTTEI
jgi:hypothetical protein